MRKAFLRGHEVCEVCRVRVPVELDHREPIHRRPDLFWTESNWRAICSPCHIRVTEEEKARERMKRNPALGLARAIWSGEGE